MDWMRQQRRVMAPSVARAASDPLLLSLNKEGTMNSVLDTKLRLSAAAICVFAGAVSAQEAVVKIGHVAPTSGWMAAVGAESENGARMAIDELNAKAVTVGGKKVRFELLARDDAADPSRAPVVARELVAANVNGVVGHLTSGSTIAAAKIYSDAGVPQVSPSATSPVYTRSGYKTAFRTVGDDALVGSRLGRYAIKEMKATRFAVIDDRSAYGRGVAEEFSKAVAAAGGSVVDTQYTDDKATDFATILAAVKAKNADVVFFGGMTQQAGPMLIQMKQLGIGARFMGGDGLCVPDLVSNWARGSATDGQIVCASPGGLEKTDDPATIAFLANYAKRSGSGSTFFGPYAYDAVMVLADAMVRADSTEPARYLAELAKTKGYKGATGTISFDEKGDVQNAAVSIYTYTAQHKALVQVVR
jgi:branched-chain amino acid transport system substrate-binding protein